MNDCKWLSDDFSYICCCGKAKNYVADACPYDCPDDAYWNCPCYEKGLTMENSTITVESKTADLQAQMSDKVQKALIGITDLYREFCVLLSENERLRNQVNSLMGWELAHAEVKEIQTK